MRQDSIFSKVAIASFVISSSAFTSFRIPVGLSRNNVFSTTCSRVICPPLEDHPAIDEKEFESINDLDSRFSSNSLIMEIRELLVAGQVEAAIALAKDSTDHPLDEKAYQIVLQSLSDIESEDAPDIADNLLHSMLDQGLVPSNVIYNLVIAVWSKSTRKEASKKCIQYLRDLWSCHEKKGDDCFVPMRSSYISSITSLSRSTRKPGSENAEAAEALLEEMEERRHLYPQLAPNAVAVNAVL